MEERESDLRARTARAGLRSHRMWQYSTAERISAATAAAPQCAGGAQEHVRDPLPAILLVLAVALAVFSVLMRLARDRGSWVLVIAAGVAWVVLLLGRRWCGSTCRAAPQRSPALYGLQPAVLLVLAVLPMVGGGVKEQHNASNAGPPRSARMGSQYVLYLEPPLSCSESPSTSK